MDGGVDLEAVLQLLLEDELDESSSCSLFEAADDAEMDEELMALAALRRVWPNTHEEDSGLGGEIRELPLQLSRLGVGLLVDVSHARSFPSLKKGVN